MFEVANNSRVICGENTLNEVPKILEWYGKKKVFIGLSNSASKNEIYKKLIEELEEKGIDYYEYKNIKGEPDLNVINEGRDKFEEEKCDSCLAIGGGSVIDSVKAIGMLVNNGGKVEEYQMEGRQVKKVSPFFIAVPTTAGTGSEATKVSVIENNYNGLKKSIYHNTMIADIAILDPCLTTSLPKNVTAMTGMDALAHSIESYVSLQANPISEMYGLKAISLIKDNLVNAYNEPDNIEARKNMLLASYFGGMAITASIGIAHIMGQPLGAVFNVPHGGIVSIFLPLAMELNLDKCSKKYEDISKALDIYDPDKSEKENGLEAIKYVKNLRNKINAPDSLKPYIDKEISDEEIVDVVMKTTGHVKTNPVYVDSEVIKDIYKKAIE